MEPNWREEFSQRLPKFRTPKGSIDHRLIWKVVPEEGDWSRLALELWDQRAGEKNRQLVARRTTDITGAVPETVVNILAAKAEAMASLVRVVDSVRGLYS